MFKSIKSFLLLFIIIIIGCASHPSLYNPQHNWHKSNYQKHNGVVAITIDSNKPYCSGIVLNKNLILTAGHCADPKIHKRLYITSGCNNILDKECTHTAVYMAIPHPNYKETGAIWNDIGIMIPIKSIKNVKSAKLALEFETHSIIYLAGFGIRLEESGGILYSGTSKINHTWVYGFETYLNGINGPCSGDSGSPAFNKDGKVIGILSRSIRERKTGCGGMAKYTIPIMYIDWIEKMNRLLNNINQLSS